MVVLVLLTYLLTYLLTTQPDQLSNLDMATAGAKKARWSSKKKGYNLSTNFIFSYFLFQRSKHVCDADRKVTIHSRALPHHYTLQQNEDKRHESHS